MYFKQYNAFNGPAVAQIRSLIGGAPRDRNAAGGLKELEGTRGGPMGAGEVGLSIGVHCELEK